MIDATATPMDLRIPEAILSARNRRLRCHYDCPIGQKPLDDDGFYNIVLFVVRPIDVTPTLTAVA